MRVSPKLFLPLIGIFVLCTGVIADARNYNPTGEGCVDPKGFLSCYQKNIDAAVGCTGQCNNTTPANSATRQNCILGCNGGWLASNIGCWIQSCWNQVYSCEYQMTAINYFHDLGIVQNGNVPFYPPPDDAKAGACSCNLGYVYSNETITLSTNCINVAASGNREQLNSCQCCQFGWPVSNILNVCPKSDLSILAFPNKIQSVQNLVGTSTDNCAILETNPDACVTDLKFPWYGSTAYNPLALPTNMPGTEPLSNNPGNAFTDFGKPSYTVILFPAYSSVITPAAFKAGAGVTGSVTLGGVVSGTTGITGTGGSVTATGTGGAAGTPTGTGTGSSAAATSKSGAGVVSVREGLGVSWIVAALGMVGMAAL
ncbi:hypothetical protein BGZ60DRAFT_527375 [Tricladium varicosporioides]|nr:hypothetical protein BGZ60DRAFT_527375 [Hymenoscyphus varicosporioides]